MCIVAFAFNTLPDQGTLIAANRDEFHDRPTAAMTSWCDAPDIWAGRDLLAGGTWLGITPAGRFAFVTNYRDPNHGVPNARSRGELVADFLRSALTPDAYMAKVAQAGHQYNGFNLVVGEHDRAQYFCNRAGSPRALVPGLYLLSNHVLDSPWPKAERLRANVANTLLHPQDLEQPDFARWMRLMKDTTPAPEANLPATGIPLARERLLSSPFIVSPDYGTRSTTVIMLDRSGAKWAAETRYAPDGDSTGACLARLLS